MRVSKLLVVVAMHLMPVLAWASFKPTRVVAPELLGLYCTQDGICIDDIKRIQEARELKNEAVQFINDRIGRLDDVPRAVFCSSSACAKSFGFTLQGAYNVGTVGFVICSLSLYSFYKLL